MKVTIINYHETTGTGLVYIDTSDGAVDFHDTFIKENNKLISIHSYLANNDIYTLANNKLNHNCCDIGGLYFIEPFKYSKANFIIMSKINKDESEIISNIDCDSNYITTDSCKHKLYKTGKMFRDLYYCYECGNYEWK